MLDGTKKCHEIGTEERMGTVPGSVRLPVVFRHFSTNYSRKYRADRFTVVGSVELDSLFVTGRFAAN